MTQRYDFKSRVALLIAGMTSAFLVVFIITFLTGNAVRDSKKVTVSPATLGPTDTPTFFPSYSSKFSFSDVPTPSSTDAPTSFPTDAPTPDPTYVPTSSPTDAPTPFPTDSLTSSLVVKAENVWKLVGRTILGRPMEDLYGQPVSMSYDGNRVVLGAPLDDNLGGGISTVHIYDFDSSNFWKEIGRISGKNEDFFGWTIALSGDGKRLAIGAMEGEGERGIVQVYEYTGIVQDDSDFQADSDNWNKVGNTIVGLASGDGWGQSIAISEDGNRLVMKGRSSGSDNTDVRVFELIKDVWNEIAEISKVMEMGTNDYGYNVDISANGNIIAIGSQYDDDVNEGGYVQIFAESNHRRTQSIIEIVEMKDYTNITLTLTGDLETTTELKNYKPDPWLQVGGTIRGELPNDRFGYSISMNALGNMVAIGSTSSDFGQVQVFEFVNKSWVQMGQTLIGENRDFGECVALAPHSNQLAIASSNDNGETVSIYEYGGDDKWVQFGPTIQMSDSFFGLSLSLSSSGNRVAIGSVYQEWNVMGQLQVFEYM